MKHFITHFIITLYNLYLIFLDLFGTEIPLSSENISKITEKSLCFFKYLQIKKNFK